MRMRTAVCAAAVAATAVVGSAGAASAEAAAPAKDGRCPAGQHEAVEDSINTHEVGQDAPACLPDSLDGLSDLNPAPPAN
ncbi:hypothetical protein ACFVXC_17855 [Streptomyces sp. NPDC058257]|uniref:hypothetical protein n=1 Tax=Streptomyces sp. NPDC058257 TaxID=3346409 RepID=UPI0036E062B7